MSYLLAFVGFALLIILHELGHFAAAKAVGMRVERFSLFFGPLLVKVRRGETEYGIGPIPLGGYVRITGMNPREELDPAVAHRAYYNQPVWKRVVVIGAGPAVNLLIAFLILFLLIDAQGEAEKVRPSTPAVVAGPLIPPAQGALRPGDVILSVDGHRGGQAVVRGRISSHRCLGTPRPGCAATTAAVITVRRHGRLRTFALRPRYDASRQRMRVGFGITVPAHDVGVARAAGLSIGFMWTATTKTITAIGRAFAEPSHRKDLSSVVGGYKVTQQSFAADTTKALEILAVISLSLAVINLFPFLPLDGGHIFWAVAERVRGRAISFSVMERASVAGFLLVLFVFFIGLSNDISRLNHGGFPMR